MTREPEIAEARWAPFLLLVLLLAVLAWCAMLVELYYFGPWARVSQDETLGFTRHAAQGSRVGCR